MKNSKGRYKRIEDQVKDLIRDVKNPLSRMATISAVLHHKLDDVLWTGFYLLNDSELEVACYQGPLACLRLKKGTGVCWATINAGKTVIVSDVEHFEGHIACCSLSKSEIVVPVYKKNELVGCLDIDSRSLNRFDSTDQASLEALVGLIYLDIAE